MQVLTMPQEPALTLLQDLKDEIGHLEKEEELEIEAVQEQRDAEQKLAHALQGLQQEEAVLEMMAYFRNVDLNQPHGKIHAEVQKIIDKSNKVGSVNQLLTEAKKVEKLLKEVELAQKEVRDAEQKIGAAVQDEQAVNKDLKETHNIVQALSKGGSKFMEWGMGRQ